MRDLLDFKTKKDRDDFLIAIAVIGLFFSFFYGLNSCNQDIIPDELAAVAPIAEVMLDKDKDGIPDEADSCPNLAGIALNDGCPADADGDGVYDEEDKCPSLVGPIENGGCPRDGDEDGVPDNKDNCPELMGVAANNGCPPDADGDGIYDVNDKCPDKPGIAANDGCPEIKLEEAERTLIATAMQNVEFVTGSANLKPSSQAVLNQIAGLMTKYKSYKLDIDGHTDSRGDANMNLQLSQSRAQTCYNYLLNAGIPKRRISFKGYGAKRPVDSNETAEGRKRNRRVEFNLHY